MKAALPSWVQKRDGRREPFEADKISQALFAATEALGRADAFLARELTDGVLHFLPQECSSDQVESSQIAEVVEKVVRELGQPALAQAFSRCETERVAEQAAVKATPAATTVTLSPDATPEAIGRQAVAAHALQTIYGRDLAAAHTEGLIALAGLQAPRALARIVVEAPAEQAAEGWRVAWTQVERAAAPCLVIDSAEWFVQSHGVSWLQALDQALAVQSKTAILNANSATPPPWARDAGVGPLFPQRDSNSTREAAQALWQELRRLDSPRLRLDWHLDEPDLTDSARRRLLEEMLAQAPERICYVVDRLNRPIRLAEGIERGCPAVLLEVGLNLPAFLARPEVRGDIDRLLDKLPSLVRMAVSAAVQKRRYLRTHAATLARGFLLDRARLVVAPIGLAATVQRLLQDGPARSPRSLELARKIIERLAGQLEKESRSASIDIALDDYCSISTVAEGLTCPDAEAEWTAQLRSAAALQRGAGRGVAILHVPPGQRWLCLETALATDGVGRLRFARSEP